MNQNKFNTFINELKVIESKLALLLDQDENEFLKLCLQLIEVLYPHTFTEEQEDQILQLFTTCKPKIQSVYTEFVCQQEVMYANDMIAKGQSSAETLKEYLGVVVQNELDFFNLNDKSVVLDVGSGPLPITSSTYVSQTGCTVEGYDIVKEYVDISRQVVALFGLSDKIHIHNKDGLQFTGGDFDVALIAMYSYPKTPILKALIEKLPEHAKIAVRSASGLMQLFAPDNVDSELLKKHSSRIYESKLTLQTNFDGR